MVDKKTNKPKVKRERQILDYSKITNEEIKNYVRDIELRKEREFLLRERLKEEDSKIDILNKNILKLDSTNVSLESEATQVRTSTRSLSGQIAELQMELEKAKAESKLKRVKKIKTDILTNARILKDQENTIDSLRNRREEIRKEQESQRDKLLEKREAIEKIRNESVNNEFRNMDDDLIDIIESTLANNSDKTQIMSAALKEVSTEMKKIRSLDQLNSTRTNDNIEILKTQMFELNNIANPEFTNKDKFTNKDEFNNIKNAQAISSPKASITPKTARDIEAETKLIGRLDKLVKEGLITEKDKQDELNKFNSSLEDSSETEVNTKISNKKKIKKVKKKKINKNGAVKL